MKINHVLYFFWRSQNLADLEDSVHFTGARKERPERVELRHDAAYGPLVDRRAVVGGLEENLRSSVPTKSHTNNEKTIQLGYLASCPITMFINCLNN